MPKIQSSNPDFLPELYVKQEEVELIRAIIAWDHEIVPEEVVIESMLVVDYDYGYTNTHYYVEVRTNLGVFTAHRSDTVDGVNWNILSK